MGCGDWNDGMNLVGDQGKGESVWLAFFLYDVLKQFEDIARLQKDIAFAEKCVVEAGRLGTSIEENAWDGGWYRRAYFDNGEPLGSASNPECQIDSLPQSWSILSGAADPFRSRVALDAVMKRLVRRDSLLVLIFDPRSTNPLWSQDTSRATVQVYGKTVVNIPTQPSGSPWHVLRSATMHEPGI